MKITPHAIADVLVIYPKVFGAARGGFFESFNQAQFEEGIGKPARPVQDNLSSSVKNVLRGLHYQIRQLQGKLVRVVPTDASDVENDASSSRENLAQAGGLV